MVRALSAGGGTVAETMLAEGSKFELEKLMVIGGVGCYKCC